MQLQSIRKSLGFDEMRNTLDAMGSEIVSKVDAMGNKFDAMRSEFDQEFDAIGSKLDALLEKR
ncbi:hypothetical protein CHLRE_03g165471v5 [Chlamydomonas reinhardtii]|uniref:Uncharacterized protein n=1 Tax=Chlamydomonas reinhardtii TaxID=3055 RepID=A0A2K3DWP8_CHLRE|nr:uncharacterized protein CHLRE_03g165471v5 [Chlamydomonas reinhardtii]PNW84954.1 hypothetical protein CHLRE_03g165471v5 [Chlamydomonas reinhardtii]